MSENYNDMIREMGYDPTNPDHIDEMSEDFAVYGDEPDMEELEIIPDREPTVDELENIEHEQRSEHDFITTTFGPVE